MLVKRIFLLAAFAVMATMIPRIAFAHAHLLSSKPSANAVVHGPEVSIDLRYNSRVDPKGCVITLVLPGGQTRRLNLDRQSNETNLDAHVELKPGSYALRWQALSTDGHITRGEIPFTVQ